MERCEKLLNFVFFFSFVSVVKLLPDAEQLVSFMASNRRHLLKLDAKQAAVIILFDNQNQFNIVFAY